MKTWQHYILHHVITDYNSSISLKVMQKLKVRCEVFHSYNIHSKYQQKVKRDISVIYHEQSCQLCHQ